MKRRKYRNYGLTVHRGRGAHGSHCSAPGVRFNLTTGAASIGNVVFEVIRGFDTAGDIYWHSDWLGWNWAPPKLK